MKYQIGDSVRVKPGTACPDFPEFEIGGWQGRVTDLTWADKPSASVIGFAFDSITLREMPAWYIKDCEQKGLDWSIIYLSRMRSSRRSPAIRSGM